MTAKEVMKVDIGACAPGDDVATALHTMRNWQCGWAPVVDSHSKVVGVITDRDAALALADHPRRSSSRVSVRDAMSHPVFSCLPEDNLKVVLATMAKHRVRRLPVIDKVGSLQGVLSIDDIVRLPTRRGVPTSEEILAAMRSICSPRPVEAVTA
jgi:CBS domain-containing protein